MDFGVRYHFRNPPQWHVEFPEFYQRNLKQIEEVDRLGYDIVWMQEHHFVDDGYCPSPLLVLSHVAAITRSVRLATGILVLPLHNPLRVAEDVAVLDILANGRAELGVGLGYKLEEYGAFGVPQRSRVRRLEEATEVLRHAWSGEINFVGEIYQYRGVNVTPKPVQKTIPIWFAARTAKAAGRAARLGCHLNPTPVPEIVDAYVESLHEHQGGIDGFQVMVNLHVYVTADPDEAWKRIEPHFRYYHERYMEWMTAAGDPPLTGEPDLRSAWIIGDADHVASEILRLRERMPFTGVAVSMTPPGLAPEFMTESLARFAQDVVPALRARYGTLA